MPFNSEAQAAALKRALTRKQEETKPLFAARADATLDRVRDTYAGRGLQYGDTWRDCQWLMLRAVVRRAGMGNLCAAECRRIAAAVLCDVKYQRMMGGFNDDHLIDGIAYQALLAEEMKEGTDESA